MKKLREKKENISRPDPENRRKWLRFEFYSPILFRLISIGEEKTELESNLERQGQILDMSAGGALLVTKKPVAEGNFISLNLNLKGLKELKGILGKVKRVEESEQGDFLMGVEFCSVEAFPQLDQQALTKKDIQSFDKKVKRVISKHIFTGNKKEKAQVKV